MVFFSCDMFTRFFLVSEPGKYAIKCINVRKLKEQIKKKLNLSGCGRDNFNRPIGFSLINSEKVIAVTLEFWSIQ